MRACARPWRASASSAASLRTSRIRPGRPELALDAAFDEGGQAIEHRVARRRRQRESGLVRGAIM
jgi:hypothetical protein